MNRLFRQVRRLWCEHEYVERRRRDGRQSFECVACGKRRQGEIDVTIVERQRLEAVVRMGPRSVRL